MIGEYGLESYRFTCRGCAHTWLADYQTRSATDGEGAEWTVHYRDGAPAENPAADVVLCPRCHHYGVDAHLLARHNVAPSAVPEPQRRVWQFGTPDTTERELT